MLNLPIDKDKEYMYQMWENTPLSTDYQKPKVIQEIMYDDIPKNQHNLKEQSEMHQKIRNSDDYDDWDYGTEPNYGVSWK